jgi:hypothetical protein
MQNGDHDRIYPPNSDESLTLSRAFDSVIKPEFVNEYTPAAIWGRASGRLFDLTD